MHVLGLIMGISKLLGKADKLLEVNCDELASYVKFEEVTLTVMMHLKKTEWKTSVYKRGAHPRGVLRYISDGDVRSPFLGLKFAICGLFLGLKFCSDFFWVRDFGKDFFWGWQKAKPRVLVFMSNNCIMTQKLSGILLNYYYYYFF